MIKATINNTAVECPEGTSILDAARAVQVKIPTLCKHPDVTASAACGICVVRIKGSNKLLRACCTPLEQGMDIVTHDPEIIEIRRTVIELILSNHPNECLHCARSGNCELQSLIADFGIRQESFDKLAKDLPVDDSTGSMVLEPAKCIKCGRCVEICQETQGVWALSFLERGVNTRISAAGDILLGDSPCVRCGQCSAHCPTGAIFEKDETARVWSALRETDRYCMVQIAPAVRVAIGEGFGLEPGVNLTKKLYAILRRLGFHAVFDTNFAADVTIMEEASEFVERFVHRKGPLPLITTCCPSWVDYMEKFHADMVEHFSSAKSPQAMMGALAKTYYARKMGMDPARMFMVSVMPCTAKKFEIQRSSDMYASGYPDTDVVLTTRELIRMIKQAGIDFHNVPEEDCDHLMGDYSGAGVIFGATGGVMEAALRTAHHLITNGKLKEVAFRSVRGLSGVKETSVDIQGTQVRIAIAHGLGNVNTVIRKVREAKEKGEDLPYHFIEVMACPGGCIGGGGQPYGVTDEVRLARARGLYEDDESRTIRYSHENPQVVALYRDFLEKPLSPKAHHLLHTKYVPKPEYAK